MPPSSAKKLGTWVPKADSFGNPPVKRIRKGVERNHRGPPQLISHKGKILIDVSINMKSSVEQLHRQGLKTSEIAAKLGLSTANVSRYKRSLGVECKLDWVTSDELVELQSMLDLQMSYDEIAKHSKRGKGTIRRLVSEGRLKRIRVLPNELDIETYCSTWMGKTKNISAFTRIIKNRCISEGIWTHRCAECGITEWRGKPAPLEVDHRDGNPGNNVLTNLRLLCRNCHYFTETWGNKKRITV